MSASPEAILAGFRFFAWLFPATPLERLTSLSIDGLKVKYKKRDRVCGLLFLVGFVGLTVACYFVLDWLAEWHYRDISNARFVFRAISAEWGCWAGFLTLTSLGFMSLKILRWILDPKEYELYMAYSIYKSKLPPINPTKFFQWTFWIGFLPLVVLVVLRIDSYTAITANAIIENPFLSLGTEIVHPYASVRGVYEVRRFHERFKDVDQPYQLIVFADGTRWETNRYTLQQQREIMSFVAQRSGKPYQEVEFAEDIPP